MAKIISLSLPKKDLEELDALQKHLGLKGRSETVRTAVALLRAETTAVETIKGVVEGVVLIVYKEKKSKISKIIHKHTPLIKTQIHNHLQNHTCLETLLVKGRGSAIRDFVKALQQDKQTQSVRFVAG